MKIYLAALTVALGLLFAENYKLKDQIKSVKADIWLLETSLQPAPLTVSF